MRTKSILVSHFLVFNSCFLFAQNVGIGTTTPTGRIQINHRSTSQPGILLLDSATSRSGIIRFGNVTSVRYMQFQAWNAGTTSSAQYLDIWSDSTYVATFKGNGNFGLGVFNPAYRLDVNGVINSESEYRLNGKTVLRWGDSFAGLFRNFYAGDSAGFSNNGGQANTFVGGAAGFLNNNGYRNCFIGTQAGYKNVTAGENTYVGFQAGYNSVGGANTLVGSEAGYNNSNGSNNTFVGGLAGHSNFTGGNNVFIGVFAGATNALGHNNTVIGTNADLSSIGLSNATAIGARALVSQSNSIVLGSILGVNDGLADTQVGIGTTAPSEKLDVVGNIKLSGEINNPSTGTANLLPIAFGSISTTGVIQSGSGNFTVTRTAAGSYTIDITGHSYGFSTYSTVVTAIAGPFVTSTNSASGNLLVRLYNLSGVLTDGNFHFVVYKQ